MRATQVIADFPDYFLCRGAAHFGPRAGPETFGDPHAHLDDACGLRHGERLGIRVGHHKIYALQASRDHVVDRIATGAADAEHGDARLHLAKVGNVGHVCSTIAGEMERQDTTNLPRVIPST